MALYFLSCVASTSNCFQGDTHTVQYPDSVPEDPVPFFV